MTRRVPWSFTFATALAFAGHLSAAPTASSSNATFAVCKGYYALCTTAACSAPTGTSTNYSCACTVHSGYSAGLEAQSCSDIRNEKPKAGQQIFSRYYPIKSYVACLNTRPWANCLDAVCTVDKDRRKATCACPSATGAPWVFVTDKPSSKGCDTGVISSVTVQGSEAITKFLTNNALLPAFPVKVLVPPQK